MAAASVVYAQGCQGSMFRYAPGSGVGGGVQERPPKSLPAGAGEDHGVQRLEVAFAEREAQTHPPAHQALRLRGDGVALEELDRRGAMLVLILDDPAVRLLDPLRHAWALQRAADQVRCHALAGQLE